MARRSTHLAADSGKGQLLGHAALLALPRRQPVEERGIASLATLPLRRSRRSLQGPLCAQRPRCGDLQ